MLKDTPLHKLYELDISSLASFIEKQKVRRILLQAPDGLKPLLPYVIRELEKLVGRNKIDIHVSGSPSFGACDIVFDEAKAINADLIIHIGHNKYPFIKTENQDIPVYYIPAYYKPSLNLGFLNKIARFLKENNLNTVVVVASIQYIKQAKQLQEFLRKNNINAIKGLPRYKDMVEYQIIGCEYSALNTAEDVDAVLVVSSGMFHGLGACLYKVNTRTIVIDVVKQNIIDLTNLCKKTLAKRLFLVSKIMNSNYRRVCIIAGMRPGQYRGNLVEYLSNLFTRSNVDIVKTIVHYINKDVLSALDNAFNPDFFVITSCPRLAIDDFGDFYKPVLTPGEALMVIRRSLDYMFPW